MKVYINPLVVILIGIFILSGYFYKNHLYTFHFVDESENILAGKLILQGERIYKDFFVQHQPLAYFISAGINKLFAPSDLVQTIKIHRLTILFWNFIWIGTMFFINPLFTLTFSAIWEIVRFELFGSLFLSESLTLYPLVLSLLVILKQFHTKIHRVLESLVGFFAIFILVFTQQTLWFYCFAWMVAYLFLTRNNLRKYVYLLFISSLVVGGLFIQFVPITK